MISGVPAEEEEKVEEAKKETPADSDSEDEKKS